jgi:hypothetical protein
LPNEWLTVGEAGADQQTEDISTIIQEIVNRQDWTTNNSIALIITGSGARTAEAFDGTAAPLLHIEYLPPGPPVVFNDPPDSDDTQNLIAENADAGTSVGITASAMDPDGDAVTYSVDDERFAIDPNTGEITRSATGVLDFETEPSITLTVRATSSDFSTGTQDFSIMVGDAPEVPVANDDTALTQSDTPVVIDVLANDDQGDGPATITGLDTTGTIGAVEINPDGTVTYTADAGFTGSDTFDYTITDNNGDSSPGTVTVTVIPPQPPSALTLLNTIDAWQWSPPSPDSAGIIYIDHLGTLLVSDSEVNEMPIFTGDNLFQSDLNGNLLDTLTTIGFTDEPTGVTYNPENHHLFFSDDTGTRSVYELDPGQDGVYATGDDIVTSFGTNAFGSHDPEGLTYDTTRGFLHVVDGVGGAVFTVDPGPNGVFDGVASLGGDDIVTSFDTSGLGVVDAEGIAYDPLFDLLYIIASDDAVAQVTTSGTLVGMLDISAANAGSAAGLAFGPSSVNPDETSLYLVARGVDNDSHPSENDGMVYEFGFDWLLA